jgi:hypothetical protein
VLVNVDDGFQNGASCKLERSILGFCLRLIF